MLLEFEAIPEEVSDSEVVNTMHQTTHQEWLTSKSIRFHGSLGPPTPGSLLFVRPNANQVSYPMANLSLHDSLHGKSHPLSHEVELALLDYLRYMHLVTLLQYLTDRNVKLIFLACTKGMLLPGPVLLQEFLYCLGMLHKSHISKIKFSIFQMGKDERITRTDKSTIGHQQSRHGEAAASRHLQCHPIFCTVTYTDVKSSLPSLSVTWRTGLRTAEM